MKKELNIYIGIFLFLAIGMHFKQWIDHPVEHLLNMSSGGAFGVPGIAHPFVFTLIIYLVVYLLRSVVKMFSKSK
ncbi:MAG: hypothetical protein HOF69_06515 [Campylobacteraceae bacterium]|jgi:hypothetical protein|nr:hypothetical protein [Campylobacteraceae bacterium]MBT3882893.1 hypothetical protein [Campylobacteraceae bacterium]MBT4031105.1 hypothetical protein [Campylobacteraceae bacterium]MBT4179517.1 hypothetical protein [Campylobacteraceae bacterium]MBT4572796.1 hypothetical protein [Campylobacteraceae bacterium]